MIADSILDDVFHWCAFQAFVEEARETQGWPDKEKTRQRAYRLYEEELAARTTGTPEKRLQPLALAPEAAYPSQELPKGSA